MRGAPLVSLVVSAVAATPLGAQWQVAADAGMARLHQQNIAEATAPTFGLGVTGLGARTAVASNVLAARTGGDLWTVQTLTAATLRSDDRARRQWDLTAVAGSFAATTQSSTYSAELLGRARFGGTDAGGAGGIGGGVLAHDGSSSPLFQVQGNLWRTMGDDRWVAALSIVSTRAANGVSAGSARSTQPLSYADLSSSWRREFARLSLGALAGLRAGMNGVPSAGGWATADAALWFTPRAAVAASAGRTLADAVGGVPQTTFLSLAIRLAAAPRSAGRVDRRVTGPAVVVTPVGDNRQRVTISGVSASRVELMADFTDWNAVPLERAGNTWVVERMVSRGLHRVAIRVDGGEWTAPANLPRVTDDLGGTVGLITIP